MQDVFTTIVQPGFPRQVAQLDLTAQQANLGGTLMYTIPAGQGGMYRFSVYTVITQAATVSSTLPNAGVRWIDNDTGVTEGSFCTASPTGNTVGLFGVNNGGPGAGPGVMTINAQAGSTIALQTTSYASSGATPMQYSVHAKLEYLGP